MKKFLISDYDGTFHIDDESMKNNIEKVKEFRKNGNNEEKSVYTLAGIIK